jgi:hypothetical protein
MQVLWCRQVLHGSDVSLYANIVADAASDVVPDWGQEELVEES